MEITSENLIQLFSLLRSSNTDENQTANNQLQDLAKYPNTIFILFSLLDTTQDQTLRCYAYFMLANCFRNVKTKMNQEFYFQCRQQIINLLQNETNPQCIEALLTVVHILLNPNTPWPEIINFAFSIDYNQSFKDIFLTLSIFNGIIYYISPDLILQNQQNLINLALSGLNFEIQNQQIITLAVAFLYTLYISFQSKTPDNIPDSSIFQERLLEIFFHSIDSSDINYFIQIISPIINGYDNDVFIFPANAAMVRILQILQNDQYDSIFRLTVHDFFVISLTNPTYSSNLKKNDWDLLVQVEIYITSLIVSSSDETDANMWFDDVLNGVYIFLSQMQPADAVTYTTTQGQSMLQKTSSEDPNLLSNICFSLLLFYNCVTLYQDYINDDFLELIYQTFLNALNSHSQILMSFGGYYLTDLFKQFGKLINNNYMLQTLNSIQIYLNEVAKDDNILYSFVKTLDNTDPIFTNLIEICTSLLNSGYVFAQYWAYYVMGESINRSNLVAYEYFDILYKHFICIITVPQYLVQMPHTLVLICLNALINLSPEKIEPHVDEFLFPIMSSFRSTKDPHLIQYLLMVLDTICSYKNLIKSIRFEYFEFMANEFPLFIEKDWQKKIENSLSVDTKTQKVISKFINASHALEILTKFTIEYKQYFVENTIMNFLPLFFQPLKIIYKTFDESGPIFNTLILIIGNSDFFDRGEKQAQEINELQILNEQIQQNPDKELVERFEESKMKIDYYIQEIGICKNIYKMVIELFELANEDNFASNLLIIVKLLIANKCVEPDQFDAIINMILNTIKKLKNSSACIFQFAHIICEICKKVEFDPICEMVMPFVKQLLERQDNPNLVIDAITFIKNLDDFSFIFLQKPDMAAFWSSIPNIIADKSNNKGIASAVVKMMSTVCQKPKREQIFPITTPLLEATKSRLIDELNQPSGLRDNLAAFLAVLGGSVIGDNFPFKELIPLILSVIPLQYDFTLSSDIYQFISGICNRVIFNNEEMKNLYVHGLVELLSQPYKRIKMMNIDILVLRSMLHSLTEALQSGEDENLFMETVLKILNGDQTKFAMFIQSFNIIRLLSNTEWVNSIM